MEELVYEVTLTDGTHAVLKFWQSGNPAASTGCDACIGYTIYDPDTLSETEGGEMDYNESEKSYKNLVDALNDVLDFAFDSVPAASVKPSDIDPDELE